MCYQPDDKPLTFMLVFSAIMILLALSAFIVLFTSCTLSMQNISTHGLATDLVDEEQTASPQTELTIPLIK